MSTRTIYNFRLIQNLFLPEISEIILDFICQNKILRDRFHLTSSSVFSNILQNHLCQPRDVTTYCIIKPISYYQNPRYSKDNYRMFVMNSHEIIAKHISTDIDIYISSVRNNQFSKRIVGYISISRKYLPFINENDSLLTIKHKMLQYYPDFDFSDFIHYNNFGFNKITFYRSYYSFPTLLSIDCFRNNNISVFGRAQIFSYMNDFIEQIIMNNNN